MTKLLKIVLAVAAISCLAATFASAGLNANATANLYWQNGTAAGLAARNSTLGTPQLAVTATGLVNFRGADVQLVIGALDGSQHLADAWLGNGTGGCNDGNWTFYAGGRGGAYPNAFTTSPAVSGVATSQNQEYYAVAGNCITVYGTGLLWFSSAGAVGASRTSTTQYGIWAIKFDLVSMFCAGDINDPTPFGVCINPFKRSPCTDVQRPEYMTLLDGNLQKDFIPFNTNAQYLTWFPANATGSLANCPGVTPAASKSWGQLKNLYR